MNMNKHTHYYLLCFAFISLDAMDMPATTEPLKPQDYLPVHNAIICRDMDTLKFLIATDFNNLNVPAPGKNKFSPLHVAAKYGGHKVAAYLLELSANI